jgi:hypothetical protein
MKKQAGLGNRGPFQRRPSERSRVGGVERFTRSGGTGSDCFRLGFAAVELAHNIGANRPRRELRSLGLLALAIRLFVGRAHETAFDEDVSAFLDAVENVLGQAREKYRNALPLDFRDPFVFCVSPGALCGDGKER